MNKIFLIGNLTRDPEHRSTTSGVSVCTFQLAVTRRIANQSGQKESDFISIVAWRGLADTCAKYLRKGSQIGIVGTVQTRTYEKDGQKRYITEVVAEEIEFLQRCGKQDKQDEEDENPFDNTIPVDDDVPF